METDKPFRQGQDNPFEGVAAVVDYEKIKAAKVAVEAHEAASRPSQPVPQKQKYKPGTNFFTFKYPGHPGVRTTITIGATKSDGHVCFCVDAPSLPEQKGEVLTKCPHCEINFPEGMKAVKADMPAVPHLSRTDVVPQDYFDKLMVDWELTEYTP